MDHQPYESWLVVDEPLLPDQEANLQEHLKSCESCRQLHNSWQEVETLFVEQTIVQPKPGFTERWQVRLAKEFSQENERQQRRSSWIFLGSTSGAAFLVLIIMAIGFFSTVQNSTEVFISGMTFIAGLLNLTNAVQVALVPLLEVIIVSVPTLWWLFLIISASLLTTVLIFSTLRILRTRRVSL